MSSIDYIILFSLLFFVFYLISQIKQHYINRNYWWVLFIPIFLYCFILGSRYGWGADYMWYKFRFEHPYAYEEEDRGFRYLNIGINTLGLNFVGAYVIYSLLYIITAFGLLRTYKNNKYMLALFLPFTIVYSTSCIRQAVADSFVFLSFMFLNKGKKWWPVVVISLFCIFNIHPAEISIIIIGLTCYFFWNRPIQIKILLLAYILVALFSFTLAEWFAEHLPKYIQYLPLSETKFVNYQENSEYWFSEVNAERIQSLPAFLLQTIYCCGYMYLTYIALKFQFNKLVGYIFNITIIGIFLERIFKLNELLLRFVMPMMGLEFIPLGYGLYIYIKYKRRLSDKEKQYALYALVGVLLYMGLYYGRFIFMSKGCGFVWN